MANEKSTPIPIKLFASQDRDFTQIEEKAFQSVGQGSAAPALSPRITGGAEGNWNPGQINVVKDYPWTLSPKEARDEVPYIRLVEFKCNESAIMRNLAAYGQTLATAGTNAIRLGGAVKPMLDPYKAVFSQEDPTNFSYWLPYFNDTAFELTTPNWNQMESAGESAKKGIKAGADLLFGKDVGNITNEALNLLQSTGEVALQAQYPVAGSYDRPRVFAGHSERQITISFPLYNTFADGDWSKNRDLIYLLTYQNLFNKRDYITGAPPVFYSVYVPNQYYCWAASMTNIVAKNLGNVRMLNGYVVPDAYQVTLTLSEMVMPSKNQLFAASEGEAKSFVNSTTVASTVAAAADVLRTTTTPVGTSIQGTQRVTGEGQMGQPQASPISA